MVVIHWLVRFMIKQHLQFTDAAFVVKLGTVQNNIVFTIVI
jgi:hypothetical protein